MKQPMKLGLNQKKLQKHYLLRNAWYGKPISRLNATEGVQASTSLVEALAVASAAWSQVDNQLQVERKREVEDKAFPWTLEALVACLGSHRRSRTDQVACHKVDSLVVALVQREGEDIRCCTLQTGLQNEDEWGGDGREGRQGIKFGRGWHLMDVKCFNSHA